MQIFLAIGYFLIGLVQLFAVQDGLAYGLGLGSFFSFVGALFLTYIPLVGSVVGIYGATHVWDWSIWQAGTLFLWYVPFVIVMISVDAFSRR